ncbi:MAG: Ig-like domain-containing protein [Lacisediminihabitans sp.]
MAAHKSLVVTATSGSVVAALIATVAIVSSGYTAQHLDLNDGSVWVSNGGGQVIGRANTQVLELNTVVASSGAEINVIQRGSTVLLLDQSNSKVDFVDAATSKVIDSVPLPPASPELFLAGNNVVIHARGTGQVWILPLSGLAKFDAGSQPTLSLGANSVATVTPDGMLYAFSADTHQVYRVNAANSDSVDEAQAVNFGDARSKITITSVGGQWVLFDSVAGTLFLNGRTVNVSKLVASAGTAVLQQPTTTGDRVLVAHGGGLISVPLAGGDPQSIVTGRTGFTAAPAVVGGCTFAAWSDGTAWRQCPGTPSAVTLTLDKVPPGAAGLEFVSNGDRVVLNDPRGGGSWAVQRRGELIDNWADLIVVQHNQQQVLKNNQDTPPQYEKTQVPPVAVDDAFGARPGKSTVLPVLLNDYDPNGDVLVISDVTPIDASIGRLDLINNQQQVQLTLGPGVTAPIVFRYTITDGRGGSASATVTVTVRKPSENSPPVQVRQTKALVVQGGRVTTSVLGDWVDPDGDAIYLTAASTAAPDTVSYKPEGTVVFSEGGAASELRSVALTVSDGKAAGLGSMAVTVKAAGTVPIIAEPFAVLTYAGQEITVNLLEHVRGGTGALRLASVQGKTGATITASLDAGTFRFRSDQVRTNYVDYVVNDGDQTVTGLVRIDVAAPPDPNTKPITIPKTIFVKTLSSHTVEVAATDIDPAGGVLLVTDVYDVPPNSGVRAEIIEQRAVRVTLTAPLDSGPVSFNYRISNGLAEAQGVITVVEIPQPARLQPPIANDDTATVRVGDAINIPVLANDVQPDGETLTLNPQLSTTLTGDSGLLFASGNVLRYLAPNKPGNFSAVYEVSGPDGQVAQAQVRIAVREAVVATNNPPVPVTVIARVLAGATVRIKIPLTGIDPDGDSVQLLGQETSPQKGSVTNVGPDYVDYKAGSYSAGTDTFTYTVIDALGARATGTVRVGISPKIEGARNPVAVEDEVRVRPGGTVSVQVLANDSDPNGSPLTVISVVPNSKDIVAAIVDNVVTVTPPKAAGRYGLVYTIENTFGGRSSNFLTVVVDPAAPRAYPIANDAVLTLSDILGRNSIDVNVLKDVFFADGAASELTVSIVPGYGASAEVTPGKQIHVSIGEKSQIIPFAVARPDDPSIVSYAFVWVPGLNDALPQLNRKAPPPTIASESTLTIDLNTYVIAVGGKQVRLTDSSTVQATHSNGANLVVDDHTLRFTSADKYFGPASISFGVTDGSSAADPSGRKATLVLSITVTPRQNQPPVFNGGVIEFEPGQSKDLELLKLTTYPYSKDLNELVYTVLNPLPQGFSYTLTGQKLTIQANDNAVKGTTTGLVLGVRDALSNGQSGRIELDVVASSRPLAKPAADSVIAPRGRTTTVDVLANDEATNPFPGKPLKVIAIRGLNGGSIPAGVDIMPSPDNSRLTVTVASTAQPGDTNLQYQVSDATGDPDRYGWGSITVSVQDRPDIPQAPVRAPGGYTEGLLTLSLKAPQFNNSPITKYEVKSSSHGTYYKDCGLSQRCDLSDLTPGLSYQFTVVATTGQGASDPSPLSVPLSADYLPAAPTVTSVTPTNDAPGGGSLRVAWAPVADPNPGSPVVGYTVRIGGLSIDVGRSGTSLLFTNSAGRLLPNTAYPVSVYARNSAQVTSDADWRKSAALSVTTVGPPSRTAPAPSASIARDGTGNVLLSYGNSDGNGRPVTYSYGRVNGSASAPACAPGPGKPDRITLTSDPAGWRDTNTTDGATYTYFVYADNGLYCTASASGPILRLDPPGQATGSASVQAHGTSGQFDIQAGGSFSVASGTAAKYQYQLNGVGAWTDVVAGQWLTSVADSSVYGWPIAVTFRGCRDASNNYCGPASTGTTLVPVETRAAVTSCLVNQPPLLAAPNNNGAPATVSYRVSYNQPVVVVDSWSGWDEYSPADPVPANATQIRVRATVTIGSNTYTDPLYGVDFACK